MATIFVDFNDWIDDQVLAAAGPRVRAFPRGRIAAKPIGNSSAKPNSAEVIELSQHHGKGLPGASEQSS